VTEREAEKIALIDLDGTLADYDGAMKLGLAKMQSPFEYAHTGERVQLYDDTPEWLEARMKLIKNQPGFWRTLPQIPMGMLVYALLGELGYRRMILTKGPRNTTAAWTEKVDWCRVNVPDADITVTHDKGLVYGKVLFDDYPPYITRWLEWRPRGHVLMLATPYNQGFAHPNVLRIDPSHFGETTRMQVYAFLDSVVG